MPGAGSFRRRLRERPLPKSGDRALETALIALGFYLADRVLTRFAGSFGLMGKGDVAVLPLMVLAAGAVSLALMPVANALRSATR